MLFFLNVLTAVVSYWHPLTNVLFLTSISGSLGDILWEQLILQRKNLYITTT